MHVIFNEDGILWRVFYYSSKTSDSKSFSDNLDVDSMNEPASQACYCLFVQLCWMATPTSYGYVSRHVVPVFEQ